MGHSEAHPKEGITSMHRVVRTLALPLVAISALASAQAPPDAKIGTSSNITIIQNYSRCVSEKAVSLARSGELAEVLAEVALRSCEFMVALAGDAANVQLHLNDPALLEQERQAGRPRYAREDILNQLRKQGKDQAMAAVIEAKAAEAASK